ncbi:MAG: hypothetical protein IKA77_03470 [Clostridia bacterium]|nr:hypothetical protein [Clostridia bacterium]
MRKHVLQELPKDRLLTDKEAEIAYQNYKKIEQIEIKERSLNLTSFVDASSYFQKKDQEEAFPLLRKAYSSEEMATSVSYKKIGLKSYIIGDSVFLTILVSFLSLFVGFPYFRIKNYVMGGAHLLLTIVNVILFFFESTLAYAIICIPVSAIFVMISSFFLSRVYSKYNLKKLKEYVSKLQ